MRTAFPIILWLCASLLIGCDERANRTVTDGVDIEAIRKYEADQGRMEKLDTDSMDEAEDETDN